MTADRIALTQRMIGRLLVFILTLIVGLGLGQIFPLQQAENSEIAPVKQSPCSRRSRPMYR
jgi:hypothetical protein